MLKIYLDWNCINNIQTKYPKLYELIKEYGHLFIFPYSNAHIRDLIVSHKPDNSYFESDIETLCEICGKHHLLFENNIMQPLFGFPKEYVKTYGDALEIVQKSELITPEQYQLIKQSVREGIPSLSRDRRVTYQLMIRNDRLKYLLYLCKKLSKNGNSHLHNRSMPTNGV